VIHHFGKAPQYSFQLEWAEQKVEAKSWFISVANSNQFGNGFTIAPKASLDDGLLDVVVVKEQSKTSVVLRVLKQVLGLYKLQSESDLNEKKRILYIQSDRITIHNPELAPLHIDGDPADTASSIRMEIIPSAFQLIRPVGRMNKKSIFGPLVFTL
jgi:diacylglycerol kinase family enzyme